MGWHLTGWHDVRRDTINVVLSGLLVQLIGFLKLLLIARYFGTSAEIDGYYLALAIPAVFQGFATGALQTGFLPIYVSLRSKHQYRRAERLVSAVFYRLVPMLLVVSLLFSLFSKEIIVWLTPASSAAVQEAAAAGFRILSFTILGNGLIDYVSLILNAHHRYVAAALGPGLNAAVASMMLLLWPEWGLDNLIYGLVIGMLAQLFLLLAIMGRKRIGMGMASFVWQDPDLKRVYWLTLPILLGVALVNANNTVIQFFAAVTGDGGVSTLGYASRLHGVFLQVVVIGVSAVLLPNLAEMLARKRRAQIHALLRNAFFMSLTIGIVMVTTVDVMGMDIVTLLLQRGQFGPGESRRVALVWLIYTFGLFPIAWGVFIGKYFQAAQRPWTITRLAVLSFAANTTLAWLLLQSHGLNGLAAASGLAYLLVAIGYHRAMMRDLGMGVLVGESGRILTLLAMGLAGWYCIHLLQLVILELPLLVRIAINTIPIMALAMLLALRAGFVFRSAGSSLTP